MAMENLELLACFDHDQFPGSRDAEEPAIHPYRRAEVIATHTFLVTDVAGRSVKARHDAAVAPEPGQFAGNNTGRHIRSGLFHLISQLGFAADGRVTGLDGNDEIPATAAAAGTENDIA